MQLIREEKVQFIFQSAFKVNRNNVKMLKIFGGSKMCCQKNVDGRYFPKKIYFLFFCVLKSTFQFCNQVYFELFLKQSLMTIGFDLEIWFLDCSLKVPKREIFNRSDFPDFYTIKSLLVGEFGVKIKKSFKNI